jgi:hypothetical protein
VHNPNVLRHERTFCRTLCLHHPSTMS